MKATIFKQMSDAFLPKELVNILKYKFIKVCDADINGWSFMHMATGFLLASVTTLPQAIFIHCLWELFQFTVDDNRFDAESFVDITLDTLFFIIGWLMFKIIFKKKSNR